MAHAQRERPRLLIVKVGDAPAAVVGARVRGAARGDYDAWFAQAKATSALRTDAIDPRGGDALPPPSAIAGAIVSGSSSLVTDREPWSERTGRWMRACVEQATPLLGVCYGHQLLADALGGRVGANPRGREIGTVEVALTAAAKDDALFGGLPGRLVVQASHRQSVLGLPPGAVVLAANAHDPHQALRFGQAAWGVQFHPEMDAAIARGFIEARAERCREEGLDPAQLIARTRDSLDGATLLRRFTALVAERARAASPR